MTHTFEDHHHDVICGDCHEPLRITCSGVAARYTEAACPFGQERQMCAACATKPRCRHCGEIIDDTDARDAATESGIAREADRG